MDRIYDVIIIGTGPAGLAAAIYAKRAKLHMLLLDKSRFSGGQVLTTYEVDNYPGFPGISGMELGKKFKEHAETLGAEAVAEPVLSIVPSQEKVVVQTSKHTYEAKTVLVATGADHRLLGVPGEEELAGAGVSYCATCDGAFFKNKTTAVVGGGDVAVEDAIFLARLCKKVYLIHRRGQLRAAKSLQEKLFAMDNVEVLWDTVVTKVQGDTRVETIGIRQVQTQAQQEVAVDGLFIAVGIVPNSGLLEGVVELDEAGYVKADETGRTSHPRIFAAGDVRTKELRQIVTAVADGANAVAALSKLC
jgi:thioredoxin reductase (NADPH)